MTLSKRSYLAAVVATVAVALLSMTAPTSSAASVSGNPVSDGWTLGGHSMINGDYVRGSANYGFNMYSAAISIASGSNLEIADGANSWLTGDTVIGVGGTFENITAGAAGWAGFTGNGVNQILGNETKLIAKFGSPTANFSASTIAPDAGNGAGSTSNAGTGGVFMRTSGWNSLSSNAAWIAGDGVLQPIESSSHISRNGGSIDRHVGRMIWDWDNANEVVTGWQLLLNTSLMDRLDPGMASSTPVAGGQTIMSVQFHDSVYTDALIQTVPEPASIALVGIAAVGLLVARRRLA